MDNYDCHTEVFYGAMTFSPEAPLDTKERTITLPVGTEIDDVIRANFTKRVIVEDITEKEPVSAGDKINDQNPDLLTKLTKDSKAKRKPGRPKKNKE